MNIQRNKQVQAINQILRQQRKSMSKLNLFDQGALDYLPVVKPKQSQNMPKFTYAKHANQSSLQSNPTLQPNKNYNKFSQQTSEQQHADQDEIYNMNLSPISRLSLKTKRQIVKRPVGKKKISLSQHEFSKKSIRKQGGGNVVGMRWIGRSKGRQKLESIAFQEVEKYIRSHPEVFKAEKAPEEVYNILRPLLEQFGVEITLPLIKQYRNCTYFGTAYDQDSHHQGFLIFQLQKKVYFGQMLADKKNGKGIEIDFAKNIVFKGQFEKGRKKGSFQVIKPTEKYIGHLLNDQYTGYGKLFTDVSIYNGYFQEGLRHGQGQQFFPQTGLKISGTFLRNQFTNNQQKLESSRFKNQNNNYKNSLSIKNNPEQSFKTSRLQKKQCYIKDYNYELRGREVNGSTQMNRQSKSKKRAGYICKRRRSIQQEQPLPKIIQWADKI